MKKITTHNYEAFYLDYLEGNLDDIEQAMLFDFLNANPNLKAEFEKESDVLEFTVHPDLESLSKFEKEDLKYFDCKANEICLNNVADFMVAEVEGEISADKKIQLHNFVVEHELELDKNYFNATVLQANLAEVYPHKNELKKATLIIPLWVKISAVAAVGLLLFNFLGQSSNNEVYTPRQNDFALHIDANITPFEFINTDNKPDKIDIVTPVTHNVKQDFIAEQNINKTEDTAFFIVDKTPINDIVKEEKQDEELENQTPKNDDVAVANELQNHSSSTSTTDIKLVDMYKPVTSLANSYTNLNMSYKKSVPESEYQVTTFSIGKFSFERKRKR